jgi:hypothetical protein
MFRNKTVKDLKMVALEFACSSVLPANLLGDIRTREIHVYGSGNQPFLVTLLSPDVFRSSEVFTEELFIYDSDLTGTDWTFVKNFKKMKNIFIRRSTLNNLNSIPHLPTLESLHLDTPLKLEDLMWPTMNVTNLTSITIANAIDLDKNEINSIVNNFPQNLLHVQLSSLNLTQVPSKIRRLNKLKTLDLSTNSIHHISVSSLPTFSQIEFIDFRSNELKSIDKDALRGLYFGYCPSLFKTDILSFKEI